MERALGEVPGVKAAFWDWRFQKGYVRFHPDRVARVADLQKAITTGTMYSSGTVHYIEKETGLPDALR